MAWAFSDKLLFFWAGNLLKFPPVHFDAQCKLERLQNDGVLDIDILSRLVASLDTGRKKIGNDFDLT